MKKYFFLLFIILSLFLSCKKEKSEPCTPTNYTGMLPLHIGNQWIYRTTYYDTSGAISNYKYDTLQIIGDTIINCETKYLLHQTYLGINSPGPILFMSNLTDGFNISYEGSYYYPIQPGNNIVFSGDNILSFLKYMTCDTLTFRDSLLNQSFFSYSYLLDSVYTHGDPELGKALFLNSYYSYGIGLIFQKNYGYSRLGSSYMTHNPQQLHSTMELLSYILY